MHTQAAVSHVRNINVILIMPQSCTFVKNINEAFYEDQKHEEKSSLRGT